MMFRSARTNNLFTRYLISYVMVMVVSVAIASVVHLSTLRTIEDNAIANRIQLLQHSTRVLDDYLFQLNEITEQISFNPKLMSYRIKERIRPPDGDVWGLIQTHKNLAAYTIASPFKESFFIFFENSELVMSRQTIHYGFGYHYTNVVRFPDLSFAQWRELLFNSGSNGTFLPARPVSLSEQPPESFITYLYTLPSYNRSAAAAIAILIREQEVQALLEIALADTSGWAYITDSDGEPISSVFDADWDLPAETVLKNTDMASEHNDFEVAGERLTVSHIESSFNDWRYSVVVPTKSLHANALQIQKFIIAVASVALLVGVGLSYFLARYNSKPIQDVLAMLRNRSRTDSGDAYDGLKKSVSLLIANNRDLHETVDQQIDVLTVSFINQLIKGEFSSEQDIAEMQSYTSFTLTGSVFIACILRISYGQTSIEGSTLRELDLSRVIIDGALRSLTKGQAQWLMLRPDEIVVVLGFIDSRVEENRVAADHLIDNLTDILHREYRVRIYTGIGMFVTRLIDVHQSYNTALRALEFTEGQENLKVWFEDMKSVRKYYEYPLQIESQIVNYARAGNTEEVERILDRIYQQNVVVGLVSDYSVHNLVQAISGTVYRIIDGREDMADVVGLLPNPDEIRTAPIDELFGALKNAFRRICDVVSRQKRSHNQNLIDEIIEYIEDDYHNTELSIALLSSDFHLSETYFSQFFKEQTGTLFSAYLEGKRIQSACEILEDRNGYTIEQIAHRVGYTNTRSFRRAFKRAKGVSPSKYAD